MFLGGGKQTCYHKYARGARGAFTNHPFEQMCSVNKKSTMRSYYFGTRPKQRTRERNMATRLKHSVAYRLLLGLTLEALRPTNTARKVLKIPPRTAWEAQQAVYVGRCRTFLLSDTVSQITISVSLLRLNCNKMESTAALCSSFLHSSDQSPTIRRANSQPAASGRGVHACCQTADVNYWPHLRPLFPLLALGFFRREVKEYVNKSPFMKHTACFLATVYCQWLQCNKGF